MGLGLKYQGYTKHRRLNLPYKVVLPDASETGIAWRINRDGQGRGEESKNGFGDLHPRQNQAVIVDIKSVLVVPSKWEHKERADKKVKKKDFVSSELAIQKECRGQRGQSNQKGAACRERWWKKLSGMESHHGTTGQPRDL